MARDKSTGRWRFWALALLWLPAGVVATALVRFGADGGPAAEPGMWLAAVPVMVGSLVPTAPCGLPLALGWTPQLREKNLPLVIDNPRFLILPWIVIPNLGSHILSLVRRQLPDDWTQRYNVTPVLIETFVETPRFTGALYKASGWTHVGTTQGRGRRDRHTRRDRSKKDVWIRPLRKDWRRTLNG